MTDSASTTNASVSAGPQHSKPLAIRNVTVTDSFWHAEQELVRTAVIPFQWRALNDQVPGAEPSYCMHNFKAAAAQNAAKHTQGTQFVPPTYTDRGFNALPDDPAHPDDDKFYGFVFQDTDFSKWIEAVGYSLAQHPDAELEATADQAIDIVCAAQLDNGYLDTYYILNGMDRHFTNLKDHHELYCLGHLVEGAVAYYQGTGKDKLLKAAARFADYVASRFGTEEGKLDGYPGHEIAEMALVRLAEATGESKYADLAAYFVRQRGQSPLYFEREDRARAEHEGQTFRPNTNKPKPYAYYQAHEPAVDQHEAVGHAVRAAYFYSGLADVARITGDKALTDAAHKLWRNIVDKKLYLTGGIGGTRHGEAFAADYELANDLAYSETCAAIALAFFSRRMLEIEAKSEYADVMETALYNTVLAGMALDGKSFFYVNPLEVRPRAVNYGDDNWSHVKTVRQKWFGCACCPPNIARIVESVQEYAYTLADDGNTLFTHLYMGGSAACELAGHKVTLDVTANLPWEGTGKAIFHTAGAAVQATLAFRLPAWAGGAAAANAVTTTAAVSRDVRDGYLYLTGEWHDGDTIAFDFPMPVRMVVSNPRVSENTGRVAFVRGPIVFAAEGHDNGEQLQSLFVDTASVGVDCSGVQAVPFDFTSGATGMDEKGTGEVDPVTRHMVMLRVPALREAAPVETPDDADLDAPRSPLYTAWRPVKCEPVTATLIPYFAWANRGQTEMRVWLNAK
ncbi:glycoside hydrolase family 127 protein [Bifidobacterium oedipodis]|uniref:Beta-L-arabinofuranosidase n=1 Tax=Bifidobacterium oedipodis TaxID=2675322 RepID=A0A7Y0HUB4_9BIFI|nr:beta-L-arabinofuranosidase domain-containing protein [Bifidobacterium sp. DSM 109957]NMM94564.1 Beta-L-arabinofuranosidase [Bifidobacterium sp. DSM 109957]